MRSQIALERLRKNNPECKIIVCLRNPVDRAFSSYLMESKWGEKLEDFEVAVRRACIENDWSEWRQRVYVGLGNYHIYLKQVFQLFRKENIHIVMLEDLKKDTNNAVNDLFSWLGISKISSRVGLIEMNEFKVPRSKILVMFIKWIRSERNIAKKLLKAALTVKRYQEIAKILKRSSLKKAEKPTMKAEIQDILYYYYSRSWDLLRSEFLVDTSNWERELNS